MFDKNYLTISSQLSPSLTQAFNIINEFNSANTEKAYTRDLLYWKAWLTLKKFNFSQDIHESHLLTFIVEHSQGIPESDDEFLVRQRFKFCKGVHKLATIKRRIASLSSFLDKAQLNNPCRSKSVKELLSKLTKKLGISKPAGKAITRDILIDILDTCHEDNLIDVRDKALLLFAWASGGRRRSEVVQAHLENLVEHQQEYIYTITHSKTDQEGRGYQVPIKGLAARALRNWLKKANITEGYIFRSLDKAGRLGLPLSGIDIYRIVKKRLKMAGYDQTQYGAHSLRSGFVTEAGRRGKPIGDVMQLTTHRSLTTVMKYYQAGSVINNSAADLID